MTTGDTTTTPIPPDPTRAAERGAPEVAAPGPAAWARSPRWRRIHPIPAVLGVLGAVLAALLSLVVSPAQAAAVAGSLVQHSFTNAAGTRDYLLDRPDGGGPLPLVVFLHGCGAAPTAYGLHLLGERNGFAVVYPVQSSSANPQRCWNWSDPANQRRDSGEPSIIAGITREVIARDNIDPARVFIAGHSAGSNMTAVMTAAYPDLYAAAGLIAGCGNFSCRDVTGLTAYREMGIHARPVPAYTVWGTNDTLDPYPSGRLQLLQWLGTNDLADDGLLDLSVPRVPTSVQTRPASPGQDGFTVEQYRDARDCATVDFATDIGGGHIPDFTDPTVFPAMTAFLLDHPLRRAPTC